MKNFYRFSFMLFLSLILANSASACINCNNELKAAIFNSTFYPNLFLTLSPFVVLTVVVTIISAISAKKHRTKLATYPGQRLLSPVPLTAAATVLGIGLGGFVDGIVFHQILQWHEMLSSKIPPVTFISKSVNMFWDGIFHAFTLLVTITGVLLLWKLMHREDVDRSGNLLAGGLLFGWGLFNILEGIADHHILKLHNVKEVSSSPEAWNYAFLGFSVILLAGGLLLSKQKRESAGSE